jgi:acid phosphatase
MSRNRFANRFAIAGVAAALAVGLFAGCAGSGAAPSGATIDRIEHIVVVYLENRSFDHLYGMFPGADGVANATPAQYTQVDNDGTPLPHLPPVWSGTAPNPAFPQNLPNRPFRLDLPPINVPLSGHTRDLIHKFYPQQEQINGGRNDRFVAVSDAGALAMGYYDGSPLPLWKLAQEFVLADRFFMAAFGDSYINHFWLVCACTPRDAGPPNLRAQLDDRGWLKRPPTSPPSALQGPAQFVPGEFTTDGYSLSTNQPPYQPSRVPPAPGGDPRLADRSKPILPPQTQKTIGDTLSAKGVSWAWYAGSWNAAVKDGMQDAAAKRTVINNPEPGAPYFVTHHQPFNYFARFAPGTADREKHLKDYTDLVAGIDKGDLPAVAFYKPQGTLNQHPGSYADILSGDRHVAELIERIRRSPLWPTTAIIVTYDENGGFWDHVAPPRGDRWGPGTRIPAIIVSPLARRGYVDHTSYDTTSIIKFITRRFGLEPLPGVRPGAGDLTAAFAP